MIYQHWVSLILHHIMNQRLDKIYQMVDLFEFAATVLIELAIAR